MLALKLKQDLKLKQVVEMYASIASEAKCDSRKTCIEILDLKGDNQGLVDSVMKRVGVLDSKTLEEVKLELLKVSPLLRDMHLQNPNSQKVKSFISQKLRSVQNGIVMAQTSRQVVHTKLFLIMECYVYACRSHLFYRLSSSQNHSRLAELADLQTQIMNCDVIGSSAESLALLWYRAQLANQNVIADAGLSM